MLPQIDNQTIIIASATSQAVRDILSQRNLEGYSLPVFVSGSSCCGVQYGMSLEKDISDTDATFEFDGIKVVVDEVSIDYLRGSSIDFIDDPQCGSGFLVKNPDAGSSCGDGEGNCSGCG